MFGVGLLLFFLRAGETWGERCAMDGGEGGRGPRIVFFFCSP